MLTPGTISPCCAPTLPEADLCVSALRRPVCGLSADEEGVLEFHNTVNCIRCFTLKDRVERRPRNRTGKTRHPTSGTTMLRQQFVRCGLVFMLYLIVIWNFCVYLCRWLTSIYFRELLTNNIYPRTQGANHQVPPLRLMPVYPSPPSDTESSTESSQHVSSLSDPPLPVRHGVEYGELPARVVSV